MRAVNRIRRRQHEHVSDTTQNDAPVDFEQRHRTNRRPAETRARPRRIADLLVLSDRSPAGDWATDTRGAHSSSHWVMIARKPDAGKQAPALVKALAGDPGVDNSVTWDVLDGMYS